MLLLLLEFEKQKLSNNIPDYRPQNLPNQSITPFA